MIRPRLPGPAPTRGRTVRVAAALALALSVAPPGARPAPPEPPVPATYESCAGWGLCTFRLTVTAPGGGERVRVRLRGVGDPALAGTCAPEREAARTIRTFVEGILARARQIELLRIEPVRMEPAPVAGATGSPAVLPTVLATVHVDGTDVVEILVHIGLGREKPLAPDATWCD